MSITTGPVQQTSGPQWSVPCTVALAPQSGRPTAPTWDLRCPPCRQDTPRHPPLPYRGDPDQSSRSPRKTALTNPTKHPSCVDKDPRHPQPTLWFFLPPLLLYLLHLMIPVDAPDTVHFFLLICFIPKTLHTFSEWVVWNLHWLSLYCDI